MHVREQTAPRPGVIGLRLAAAATAAAMIAAAGLNLHPLALLALVNIALLGAATYRLLLRWEVQLSLIALTILLVPLGRYELPGNLPFHLEPYRLIVALIAAGWIASLMTDRELRWQRAGLLGPLLALALAILISDAHNTARIEQYHLVSDVIKSLSMMVSYLVIVLMTASVIKRREQLDTVVKTLVAGGAFVALFSLIQYRTGFNIFDKLGVIPLLDYQPDGLPEGLQARGNGARVYASAQHPIALSAALVMLLPLAIYLGRQFRGRIWWLAAGLIGVAAFSTVARTGSTMLLTVLVVFIALRPRDMVRLWPGRCRSW